MPLLPIDLQTLFTQLAQVGKEQAVAKEAPVQAQALQGSALVRQTQTRDNAVNETQSQPEGPETVKQRLRKEGERERRPPRKAGKKPAAEKEGWSDPALGRNVDLTG